MKLLDHLDHSGGVFFRLRSYLPLLLLPAFVVSAKAGSHATGLWLPVSETAGVLAAVAGLGLRILTIGVAPSGTSERSTRDPRASLLNTSGPYSVVRHPLYLGNTLIAVGLALFTATWFLPTIVILASFLYHERICLREEMFLESRFGDAFRTWANQVPALVPAFARYRRPAGAFRWKRVLAREFHALFVVGAGFLFLDILRHVFGSGRLAASPLCAIVFAVTGLLFVVLTVLKKWTRALSDSGPTPAASAGA